VGWNHFDVEKLNRRPFKISDLDDEGDGFAVVDWQGGRLSAALPGGCKPGAGFTIEEAALHSLEMEVSDGMLLSNGPGLRAAKPVVGAIFVSFPN
jgi:hypothetical protein